MARAARYAGIGLLALALVAPLGGWLLAGREGLWGGLLGVAVGGGFVFVTVLTMLSSRHQTATTTMAIVMFSWLAKMVIVFVVLFLLEGHDFYDRVTFGLTVLLTAVSIIGVESMVVLRANVPYVDSGNEPAPTGGRSAK